MLNNLQLEKLKSNWGVKAESMACRAEVRIYDPLSAWQCYLLAVDPENESDILCIISTNKNAEPELTKWTLQELSQLYNADGESPLVDKEYRPRMAAELFKLLNEGVIYESKRA